MRARPSPARLTAARCLEVAGYGTVIQTVIFVTLVSCWRTRAITERRAGPAGTWNTCDSSMLKAQGCPYAKPGRRGDDSGAGCSALADGASTERRCVGPLGREERLNARAACAALEAASLRIEPSQGIEFVRSAQLGLADRMSQDAQGLVVNVEGHWKGMSVLATVRKREASRIREA